MMTPRECFHASMNHEQPDRLLLDMGKHIGSIHRRAFSQKYSSITTGSTLVNLHNSVSSRTQCPATPEM